MTTRRGLMLAMSSPSGAGKSTLSRLLLADDDDVSMSVSATTRPPRDGEIEGKDYFFLSHDKFKDMKTHDEFLEHATVFENFYGTPRKPVEAALEQGRDVLFDIDWQGVQQLSHISVKDSDLVTVFILPPSLVELESRLHTRALDSEEVIQLRMSKAESEISHWAEYDYVLINDNLDDTYKQLQEILSVERKKRFRQSGMLQFVRGLMSERQ